MFRCELCGESSAPHEKLTRHVVQTRPKLYLPNPARGGRGTEIVREVDCHAGTTLVEALQGRCAGSR